MFIYSFFILCICFCYLHVGQILSNFPAFIHSLFCVFVFVTCMQAKFCQIFPHSFIFYSVYLFLLLACRPNFVKFPRIHSFFIMCICFCYLHVGEILSNFPAFIHSLVSVFIFLLACRPNFVKFSRIHSFILYSVYLFLLLACGPNFVKFSHIMTRPVLYQIHSYLHSFIFIYAGIAFLST